MIGLTPGFEVTAWRLCQSLAESGPVSAADFDDEWTPTGLAYRDELVSAGLVTVDGEESLIVLTGAGVALASLKAPPEPDWKPDA